MDKEHRVDIEMLQDKYQITDLRLRRKRSLAKMIYRQSKDIKNLNVTRPKVKL